VLGQQAPWLFMAAQRFIEFVRKEEPASFI